MLGRKALLAVLAAVVIPLALLGANPALAVGDGAPTIESPQTGSPLYAGFKGPFVVTYDEAPSGEYTYSVLTDPGGVTVSGPTSTTAPMSTGLKSNLMTSALPAGTYKFRITDVGTHTHTAELAFVVRSGPAPTCAVVVPTGIRVNAPVEKVPTRLVSRCADLHVTDAVWKVKQTTGPITEYLSFHGNTTDTWNIYDADGMGAYYVLPTTARSAEFTDVPQNSPTVVVGRDSRLSLNVSRTGGQVLLSVALTDYTPSANAFRAWTGKPVVLSYRTCAACPWKQLRTVTTSASGKADYQVQASVRSYRAQAAGASAIWGATDYNRG